MRRLLYALVVSIIALPPAVQSQTPIVPEIKNAAPASVSAQGGSQPNKTVEDCACESQVLPEVSSHGTVVAVSYGIPSISMSTTDKNRNLLSRLGRPDLAVRVRRSASPRARDPGRRRPSTSRCATRWPGRRRRGLLELRERLLAG